MDTNAFASPGGGMGAQAPTQQQPITSPTTGISAMVKAIMDGNDAYKQRQMVAQKQAQGAQPLAQPGPPMSLTPPTDPSTMTGGMGQTTNPIPMPIMQGSGPGGNAVPMPTMSGSGPAGSPVPMPMMQGAGMSQFPMNGVNPQTMDPVTNALMSPIPGMTNG